MLIYFRKKVYKSSRGQLLDKSKSISRRNTMSVKSILKNFWLILCKPFNALKEEYKSKLAHSCSIHLTQKEYRKFCKISKNNEKFYKGEI